MRPLLTPPIDRSATGQKPMVLWARGRALRYRLEAYGTGAGTRYRLKT